MVIPTTHKQAQSENYTEPYFFDSEGDIILTPTDFLVRLNPADIVVRSNREMLDPRLYDLIGRLTMFRRAYTETVFLPPPDGKTHPTGLMYHRNGKLYIVYLIPRYLYDYAKVLSISLSL